MVLEVTEKSFEEEVINSDKHVVIDFWAEWCGPCRSLAPVLKSVSDKRDDVKIVKINVDESPNLAVQFRVQSIPTILFVKKGEVKAVKVGFSSEEDISEWIDSNL